MCLPVETLTYHLTDSTQKEQQHGTKITCTEVKEGGGGGVTSPLLTLEHLQH